MAHTLKVPDTPSSTMSSSASTLLPPGHPPVAPHAHLDGKCPLSDHNSHEYCPPQKGDLRSVCPALNTMANHGYIHRNGKDLTFGVLFRGLKECYGLTTALTVVLVTGGFLGIHRSPLRIPYISDLPFFHATNPDGTKSPGGVIDLHLIGRHNGVEHDASLVHLNTPEGEEYAPVEIQDGWVPKLVGDIIPPVVGYSAAEGLESDSTAHTRTNTENSDGSSDTGPTYYASSYTLPALRKYISDPAYLSTLVDEADVGRMRARRQREISPIKLDPVHAEIARGEMAIILGVWRKEAEAEDGKKGGKGGIPLPWLLQWLAEERLPDVPVGLEKGSTATKMWRPERKQTLSNVVKRSKMIRKVTEEIESG
ncbi:hypothetical protein D9757_007884 [Collybiopsis confluens]|uniref:Heme haloperoxidase family profile domain-containing protein n=1 Tax=Collybiopsis confluens TaxID=2823264 RepID=A0A8H5M4T5_9AGAR|nr:hypothetical protein D9757_007884 [Collybiopsis confluens]